MKFPVLSKQIYKQKLLANTYLYFDERKESKTIYEWIHGLSNYSIDNEDCCALMSISTFLGLLFCVDLSQDENFQIQSFEAEIPVPELSSKEGGPETFRGVFIRAPAILEVGPGVQVLADYPAQSTSESDPDSVTGSEEV